jgi:hypothetical protein
MSSVETNVGCKPLHLRELAPVTGLAAK